MTRKFDNKLAERLFEIEKVSISEHESCAQAFSVVKTMIYELRRDAEAGAFDARIAELESALERLRPIIQNSKEGFENPHTYNDQSLVGWRLEGLASGCRIGLEVIDRALAKE